VIRMFHGARVGTSAWLGRKLPPKGPPVVLVAVDGVGIGNMLPVQPGLLTAVSCQGGANSAGVEEISSTGVDASSRASQLDNGQDPVRKRDRGNFSRQRHQRFFPGNRSASRRRFIIHVCLPRAGLRQPACRVHPHGRFQVGPHPWRGCAQPPRLRPVR